MSSDAVIATTRFGLGARQGELAQARHDPRGWLERQLDAEVSKSPALADIPPSPERLALFFEARGKGAEETATLFRKQYRDGFIADTGARARHQIETDRPFRERLV